MITSVEVHCHVHQRMGAYLPSPQGDVRTKKLETIRRMTDANVVQAGFYAALMDLARLSDDVEVVSRGYARAHGFTRDKTWFLLKLQEEVGELTQAFLMRTGQARSKGNSPQELDDKFGAELADVLCHVVLMARHHGVNLEEQVERKWLVWHPDRSASTIGGAESTANTGGLLSKRTSAPS